MEKNKIIEKDEGDEWEFVDNKNENDAKKIGTFNLKK